MSTMPVLAHGIGARGDLPVPLPLVVYGGVAVLVATFLLLGAKWRAARLEERAPDRELPRWLRVLAWPLRVVGLVATALVVAAAVAGPVDASSNLAPYAIYIALWVGVLIASAFVGDVWRLLSPFETALALVRAVQRRVDEVPPVERMGVWPAAGLLLVFTWLELVHPDPGQPRVLAMGIGLYVGVLLLGWAWAGPAWVRSAEFFGALFTLVAAIAPVHQDAEGRLRLRPPLVGLAQVDPAPGTAALVLVALGSTTFDGISRLPAWSDLVGPSTGWSTVPLKTLGLLLTISVVAGIYVWAMRSAAGLSGRSLPLLVRDFAPSLVPIALGYAVAHYVSLLIFDGQLLLPLASDPLGQGSNLFGVEPGSIDFTVVSTTTLAWIQTAAIVGGHVAGVVLAHDRALARLPGATAARSQYALLLAMVTYTAAGLFLLLGG